MVYKLICDPAIRIYCDWSLASDKSVRLFFVSIDTLLYNFMEENTCINVVDCPLVK